jgi:transposase
VFEIVKRNELHKFVVLPKRWIVERTLAWISRNRRLARDFERYARTVAAFVADSGDVARSFRDHVARCSAVMSPA